MPRLTYPERSYWLISILILISVFGAKFVVQPQLYPRRASGSREPINGVLVSATRAFCPLTEACEVNHRVFWDNWRGANDVVDDWVFLTNSKKSKSDV